MLPQLPHLLKGEKLQLGSDEGQLLHDELLKQLKAYLSSACAKKPSVIGAGLQHRVHGEDRGLVLSLLATGAAQAAQGPLAAAAGSEQAQRWQRQ